MYLHLLKVICENCHVKKHLWSICQETKNKNKKDKYHIEKNYFSTFKM